MHFSSVGIHHCTDINFEAKNIIFLEKTTLLLMGSRFFKQLGQCIHSNLRPLVALKFCGGHLRN